MYLVAIIIVMGFIIFCRIYYFITGYNEYKGSSYYQITHNSYWLIHINAGLQGEYNIYQNLKILENQGCKFLFNIYIPRENGKMSEIDILLLHPIGIFVIESKNYSGWIFGSENQNKWTQTLPIKYSKIHKEHFYNPIFQNNTHIKALRNLIGNKIPIYSIIAFSDKCTLKKISTYSNVIITQYKNILNDIENKIRQSNKCHINNIEINNLYERLYKYSQADEEIKLKHIKNINSYNEEEEINNISLFDFKICKIILFLILLLFIFININNKTDIIQEMPITKNTKTQEINDVPEILNYTENNIPNDFYNFEKK